MNWTSEQGEGEGEGDGDGEGEGEGYGDGEGEGEGEGAGEEEREGEGEIKMNYIACILIKINHMWIKINYTCIHIRMYSTSSGSLWTVKGPSYSGLGVYSKCSTSAPTTSLLIRRYPCPSIMYDIIIMASREGSGNLRGSFVVSMSNARTTGSCDKREDTTPVLPHR